MPCTHSGNAVICKPKPEGKRRRYYRCPKCRKRRLHDVTFYEWYAPYAKCRTCGRGETLVHKDEE